MSRTKSITIISGLLASIFFVFAALSNAQAQTLPEPAEGKNPNFDGIGVVGFADFFMFADAFGTSDLKFDLNGNGAVGFDDFFIFADWFGKTYVPPPPICDNEHLNLCTTEIECTEATGNWCSGACELESCAIIPPLPEKSNQKNQSSYRDKEVFLVSSENWQDTISLVPATTWTVPIGHPDLQWCNILKDEYGNERIYSEFDKEGNPITNKVCAYPTMVFYSEIHEGAGFDIDSIHHFIRQYNAQHITIIGNSTEELEGQLAGAGVPLNNISVMRNISPLVDYFWDSVDDIVLVPNDYETALLSSPYASYINAPIVIQGSYLDTSDILNNKNVICINNAVPSKGSCDTSYATEQMQDIYYAHTKTNKLVLVNSSDLDMGERNESYPLRPSRSHHYVYTKYAKDSLSAPILASAKHEIVISISDKSAEASFVDSFIEQNVNHFKTIEYLTIISSNDSIPESVKSQASGTNISYDQWDYARIGDDVFLDLAVGRIIGITASDSSSNIARSLFYSDTYAPTDSILSTRGKIISNASAYVYFVGKSLETLGYDVDIYPEGHSNQNNWKDKMYIYYNDHGNVLWAGIRASSIPELNNSFIEASACSTCKFSGAFCGWAIRKGAIGYSGAVSVAYYGYTPMLASNIFKGQTMGKAFLNNKNALIIANRIGALKVGNEINLSNTMKEYTLIGDPTFQLGIEKKFPESVLEFSSNTPIGKKYKLTTSVVKMAIPQEVKDGAQPPSSVKNSVVYPFETFPVNNEWPIPFNFAVSLSNFDENLFSEAHSDKYWLMVRAQDNPEQSWLFPHGITNLAEFDKWEYKPFNIDCCENIQENVITQVETELEFVDKNKAFDIVFENVIFKDRMLDFDIVNNGGSTATLIPGQQLGYTKIGEVTRTRENMEDWDLAKNFSSVYLYNSVIGCNNSANGYNCDYRNNYYSSDKIEFDELVLAPGESRHFSRELPQIEGGHGFDKGYAAYEISIHISMPIDGILYTDHYYFVQPGEKSFKIIIPVE